MDVERRYMERALQLALRGLGHVSPNPMVGAVIVNNGRIIGEGWHRCWGEGHAEVNAVASVADRSQLADATMYVTLEPCSHYGKTPPCARLIIDSGIPRVAVATLDPFERVSGRGVAMLRDAGVEVEVGLLGEESRRLNAAFFTAHMLRRPLVMLKWAQSADGYIDRIRAAGDPAQRFSTVLGAAEVHLLRSRFDAVMVGSGTVLADNPRLDVRLIDGRSPRKVVLDRRGRIPADAAVWSGAETICIGAEQGSLTEILSSLYDRGITSLLVEGGKQLHDSFIAAGLWDLCRIEISPLALGAAGRFRMTVPAGRIVSDVCADGGGRLLTIANDNFEF